MSNQEPKAIRIMFTPEMFVTLQSLMAQADPGSDPVLQDMWQQIMQFPVQLPESKVAPDPGTDAFHSLPESVQAAILKDLETEQLMREEKERRGL